MSFPRTNCEFVSLFESGKIPPSNPGYPFKLTHSSVAAAAANSSSIKTHPTWHQLTSKNSSVPMALRLSISSSHGPATSPAISTCRPASCGRFPASVSSTSAAQKRSLSVMTSSESKGMTLVKSSGLETTSVDPEAVAVTGQVTEVTKDTFWPIVKAAGEKIVVLDMYTQWCGPCKVIAPKFQELSEKDRDVVFLKLDCNHDSRPLAKELGIKVVPTFKILKDGKVVKEITGAKIDELVHAIETAKSS